MRKTPIYSTIMAALLAVAPLALALDVKVWPDKVCVKPGQPVVLQITVSDTNADVTCKVVNGLDTVAATFTGKPATNGVVAFTFVPKEEWGYEVVATATGGGTTVTGSEVFACATSPYKVAVDYGVPEVYGQDVLPDGSPAPEGPVQNPYRKKEIAAAVARFRHQYLTVGELMGPAFCSFSSIKPPVPNYFKGFHYNYSANAIRELIATLHSNGIASVMYVNACLSGLAGTEFARQHPEYLAYSPDGTPFSGGLDISAMAAQQDYVDNYPASLQRSAKDRDYDKQIRGPYPGFINCLMDFRDPRLAEIGARKIIEGQEYFGYYGVRYDGEYRVPSIGDPLAPSYDFRNVKGEPQPVGGEAERLTVGNLDRAFGMMRRHDPKFLIGLNFADFRSDCRGDAVLTSPVIKTMSPGVWILDEVAKGALSPSAPENKWQDFVVQMSAQADRVRLVDNYLFAGWGGGPGQKVTDTKQVKAVSWACGLRWLCGGWSKEAWFADTKRDYNRFALRYSGFILDNRLRRLKPVEAEKTLTISGSRPVLWQSFVQRLQTTDKRYLIIHLINEPLEKGLTVDAQPPPHVENLTLTLAAGEKAVSAWFLSPDGASGKLEVKDRNLTVPTLVNWGMVVVEQ